MLALEIGHTIKWATENAQGEVVFPQSQSSRTNPGQALIKWLNEITPDAVCYLQRVSDPIYRKYLEYLFLWCAENDVKHKGFPEDLVRKYGREEPSPKTLLKFAKNHRW